MNNKPWDKNWYISMYENLGLEKFIQIKPLITTPDLLWEWCKDGKKKHPLHLFHPLQPSYHPLAWFINSKIDPAWVWVWKTNGQFFNLDLPVSEKWLVEFLVQCSTYEVMYFQTVFKVLYGWDNKKDLRLCDVFLDLLETNRSTPAVFPQKDIDCSMGEEESIIKALNALDLAPVLFDYSVKAHNGMVEIQVIR